MRFAISRAEESLITEVCYGDCSDSSLLAVLAAAGSSAAIAGDTAAINAYGAYNKPDAREWAIAHAFDTSPAGSLEQVVKQLTVAIDRLSHHRPPKVPPTIHRVSHAELETYVCETNCAIKAWYKPGEGIFLDDSLQPETNMFDRSILLHELVHYFQDMSGYYRDAEPVRSLAAARARRLRRTEPLPRRRSAARAGSPTSGNNCHAAGVMNDGILRRQVFSGKSRDIDTDD